MLKSELLTAAFGVLVIWPLSLPLTSSSITAPLPPHLSHSGQLSVPLHMPLYSYLRSLASEVPPACNDFCMIFTGWLLLGHYVPAQIPTCREMPSDHSTYWSTLSSQLTPSHYPVLFSSQSPSLLELLLSFTYYLSLLSECKIPVASYVSIAYGVSKSNQILIEGWVHNVRIKWDIMNGNSCIIY